MSGSLTDRVLGDFVVREQLGEGGAGMVFRAEQPLLGREAVIKVMRTRHGSAEDATQRFLREARLASRLDHPYSAHIYAFGAEQDGLLWIAMERVKGTPLDAWLRTRGPIPLPKLVPLLMRICEVVHSAHEQGVVHRDLKPGNVMVLARSGRLLPKLLDFGVAKLKEVQTPEPGGAAGAIAAHAASAGGSPPSLSPSEALRAVVTVAPAAEMMARSLSLELTQGSGGVIGSPHYMAPEQWTHAADVDARTDIYALGVLTWQCLKGTPPFDGGTVMALARAHASKPPPPLGEGFAPALDAVLAKAMAKRPEDRFATTLAFAEALRDAARIDDDEQAVPRLDEALLDELAAEAPRPIADACAELDAASSLREAWHAAVALVEVCVRMLGLFALAARARVGPGEEKDAPDVDAALLQLRTAGLDVAGCFGLAVGLTRPFQGTQAVYPVPELVTLLHGAGGATRDAWELLLVRSAAPEPEDPDVLRLQLEALLHALDAPLRSAAFVCEYQVAVPLPGDDRPRAERWNGARRTRRPRIALTTALPPGQPVLLDASGQLACTLWPFIQVADPAPSVPAELFLLTRDGRFGARLVAFPRGFEREDEAVWPHLSSLFPVLARHAGNDAQADSAPYRGLSAFSSQEASLFFGREREVEAFLNRLRVTPLVAVVGASGAGKSSFVFAGVVASLPSAWRTVAFRPGASPLKALSEALAPLGIDVGGLREALAQDEGALGVRLQDAAARHGFERILLVVDQFEELVTLCLDVEERSLFSRALSQAAVTADSPVRIILTVRDDFLMRIQPLPGMRERLSTGLQLLSIPAPSELRRILVEPARRAGYVFDPPELPDQMVAAVADQPGALALLSFTAARLWELRDRHFRQLTRKAYEALGGVGGALAQHAEETLAAMGVAWQPLVREAFRHLVTADGTRAVVTREELRQLLGGGAPADGVVEALVRARLLVASEGEAEDKERIEITHEALLGAWPRLVRWRTEDAESVRLRDQLRAAARQWEQRGRPRGLLWRDEALAEYRLWRQRYAGALTLTEAAFGDASLALERRGRRFRRAVSVTAFAVLMAATGVLSQLYLQSESRLLALYVEQGRQALLRDDPLRGMAYLMAALEGGERSATSDFLIAHGTRALAGTERVLGPHEDRVLSVQYDPTGRWLLTGSANGTARLFDTRTGALLQRFDSGQGAVNPALFTPDGAHVLLVGDPMSLRQTGNTPELWDATTARRVRIFEGHEAPVTSAVFSADGQTLLTAGRDGTVRSWDVASGAARQVLRGHQGGVNSLAVSADGRILVSAGDDRVARVWRWSEAGSNPTVEAQDDGPRFEPGPVLRGHTDAIWRVAVTADGTRVATAGFDGTARLWDASAGGLVHTFHEHGRKVASVVFSADAARLLTASEDGAARVFDVRSGRLLFSVRQPGHLWWAQYTSDGQALLTAGTSGQVRMWRASTGEPLWSFVGHLDAVAAVAFHPGGQQVATASADRTVRQLRLGQRGYAGRIDSGRGSLESAVRDGAGRVYVAHSGRTEVWSAEGQRVHVFEHAAGRVSLVAVSADGHRLLTDGAGGATLWDARMFAPLAELVGHGPGFVSAQFSPDDRHFVTTGIDGTVRLWSREGVLVRVFGGPGAASMMAGFSPDGGRVVGAFLDGTVRVWNADTGELRHTLKTHTRAVNAVAFSPDGRRLVTASDDKTVRLWNAQTGQLDLTLEGHTAEVYAAVFSGDGRFVFSGGDDATVRAFDAHTGRELAIVGRHQLGVVNMALTSAGSQLFTAGRDGAAVLWDIRADPPPDSGLAELACRVPYQLQDGALAPRGAPPLCAGRADAH